MRKHIMDFTATSIIWTLVIGLVVGAIAKLLMPGKDPGGCIITMLLGIAGAFVGTWIGRLFAGESYVAGWIMSIIGAMILLLLYRLILKRRMPATALWTRSRRVVTGSILITGSGWLLCRVNGRLSLLHARADKNSDRHRLRRSLFDLGFDLSWNPICDSDHSAVFNGGYPISSRRSHYLCGRRVAWFGGI